MGSKRQGGGRAKEGVDERGGNPESKHYTELGTQSRVETLQETGDTKRQLLRELPGQEFLPPQKTQLPLPFEDVSGPTPLRR